MADDDRSILMLDRDAGAPHTSLPEHVRALQQQIAGLEAEADLLDLGLDAIITLDISGRIVTWSRGAERMYGWSKGEAIGQVMDELLRAERPEPATTTADRLHRQERSDSEVVFRTRGGQRLSVAVRQVNGRDRAGTPIHSVTIHEDITGREESARLDHEHLLHVSHELRAPLTAIKQFTTILLGGLAGELNQEQHRYQQLVLKNVGQLQSILDAILETTRLDAGMLTLAPEPILVEPVVADAIDTLRVTAREGGISLSSGVAPDLSATVDRTRLQQILVILIENAVKFTPPDGNVTVAARRMTADPSALLFEVSDSGCGFSSEIGERLFEPFYQAPDTRARGSRGLGLGLYICRQIVARLGGRLWATSQPKQGSTFSFTLPAASAVNGRPPDSGDARMREPAQFPGAAAGNRPQP